MSARTLGTTFLTHAPEAIRRLVSAFPEDPEAAVERAERALGQVRWQDEVAVAGWVVREPFHAMVALALVADEPPSLAGSRIREILPELWGLSVPRERTTHEHDEGIGGSRPTPLLDRVLRSLRVAFDRTKDLGEETRGLVTLVLLFSDVAKGGSLEQRALWRTRLGVDGAVHNEDSAEILHDAVRRVLGKAALSEDGRWADRARALCSASGLVGMRLRGEVERDAFSDLVDTLGTESDGGTRLAEAWSIVNHCETSAVRASLWSEELARAFAEEERAVLAYGLSRSFTRSGLAERVARMRGGALMRAEGLAEIEESLDRLRGARPVLESRLARCRVWYAEAALGALGLEATIRLLLHLSGAALAADIDPNRPWHLDLLGIVTALRTPDGAPRRYALRLLETILDATPTDELLSGRLGGAALVSFPSARGGQQALAVHFSASPEASALLTLLSIYESKPSAPFHATLKGLCDLYGLRKDDYDRVHNEAAYLATMNAARSDKARMIDFVVPGTIVEVGPGGGVVLELLAERFPGSTIVGLDASLAVIRAHEAKVGDRPVGYRMKHGDARQLPELFGAGEVSTVVFCSVLHEVFSYVEWGDPPARFRFEAVSEIVAAAYRALRPGGRIVVRDGVMPTDEPRVVEFTDPSWLEGLRLFAKAYEPRAIEFSEEPAREEGGPARVRLGARDLYEFLTTYTWGPDSFPYEVREQRAVLPRAEYVEKLLAACRAACPETTAVEVEVPADLASYLQPGYPANILPHLRIFDASGEREVSMPDVNGIWIIEKR